MWNRHWIAEKAMLFAITRDPNFDSQWDSDTLVEKLCDLLRHIMQQRALSRSTSAPPYESFMATHFLKPGMVCLVCARIDISLRESNRVVRKVVWKRW